MQCKQCDGTGTIEMLASDRRKIAADCPACGGTGCVPDPDATKPNAATLERIAHALERIAAVLENGVPVEDVYHK